MKNLCFHYHMEIEFEKIVKDHRFTLKCLPKSDECQNVFDLRCDVYPNNFTSLSTDSFLNNTIIGFAPNEHTKFYVDVTGNAIIDGKNEKNKIEKHKVAFYKYPTKITKTGKTLENYFSAFDFAQVNSNLEKAIVMMKKLHADFKYEKNITNINTTALQALELGKGVCQDYSHILIALCQMADIPARYVAGLLIGEGYSHAWVEIFDETGEGKGVWVGLDPTNSLIVDDMHIKFSCGKDYNDCLINQGFFIGGGNQEQKISVIVYECNKKLEVL